METPVRPREITDDTMRLLDSLLRAAVVPSAACAEAGFEEDKAISQARAALSRRGVGWRRTRRGARELYFFHNGEPVFASSTSARLVAA